MALTQIKAAGIAADAIDETKIADNGIDSEHYNDGSIDNAHLADNAVDTDEIADDAVTLAKMDALARGKLIVGDASGNPSALAAGSDNYVLTMDSSGDCGWEAASSGGAALSNDANNRVVTADGSGGINGEAGLTCDGTHLSITDGNLVIATAGHGIDFSATSDGSGTDTSELLDDYEEGTWTPVHNFGGGSTGIGYSQQGGFYIKIGRKVFASFVTGVNNLGSDTGAVAISGLPYTAHNESLDRIAGGFSFFGSMQGTLNGPLFCYGFGNTTEFGLYAQNHSGGSVTQLAQIDDGHFTTASHFRGWVHYMTDS